MFDRVQFTQQDLREFSESLHAARFSFLLEQSNGILQDTWCESDGRMRYWPGGKSQWNTFFDPCDEEQSLIDKFCKDFDCVFAGIGCGRVVVSPENLPIVFKVARYGMSARMANGVESNKLEVDRWKEIGDSPLAEILEYASDYSWVCMPQAKILSSYMDTANVRAEYKQEVCTQIEEQVEDVNFIPGIDVRDVNVGLIDGEWKLIDYGRPDYDEERMYGLFPSAIHMFVKDGNGEC